MVLRSMLKSRLRNEVKGMLLLVEGEKVVPRRAERQQRHFKEEMQQNKTKGISGFQSCLRMLEDTLKCFQQTLAL